MSREAKPLSDAEALAMLSERESVSSGPAPALVTGTKRRAENSIEELEMRTARLRQAARGGDGEDAGEIKLLVCGGSSSSLVLSCHLVQHSPGRVSSKTSTSHW